MLINKEINAGQMMAYLASTQMIQRSFTQISILFGQFLKGLSSGGRVFEVCLFLFIFFYKEYVFLNTKVYI